MIKFFRKVRQQLVWSGSLTKYTLYAIGEILLLVIGILIALQVNNWNQQRTDRALEKNYYCRFLEDSEQDRTALVSMMETTRARLASANNALRILQSENPLKADLGLAEYKAVQGSTVLFEPNTTAYQDLISGSNLNLITNKEAKQAIDAYYKSLEGFINIMSVNNEFLTQHYYDDRLIYETGWIQSRMQVDRLSEGLEKDVYDNMEVDFSEAVDPALTAPLINRELRIVSIISRRLELENRVLSEISRFQTVMNNLCLNGDG